MGPYVCNRACEKVAPLYDNVYLARSGSAADCQTVADYGIPAQHIHLTSTLCSTILCRTARHHDQRPTHSQNCRQPRQVGHLRL